MALFGERRASCDREGSNKGLTEVFCLTAGLLPPSDRTQGLVIVAVGPSAREPPLGGRQIRTLKHKDGRTGSSDPFDHFQINFGNIFGRHVRRNRSQRRGLRKFGRLVEQKFNGLEIAFES